MGAGPRCAGAEEVDRYLEARPVDMDQWLLRGHVHSSLGAARPPDQRRVDVRGYAPVPEAEIAAIIVAARRMWAWTVTQLSS